MKIKLENVPYTQVANSVIYDSNLSWKAKGIFAYIYAKPTDWDFASERMAKDSNDGLKALLSGLKELEASGYLKRAKLPSGKVEYWIVSEPTSLKRLQAESPNGLKPKRLKAEMASITKKEEEQRKNKISNKEDVIAFEEFWKAYPKRESKKECFEKWKTKKLTSNLKEILEFISKAKETDRWKKGFVKQPATFLNKESWNDDLKAYNDYQVEQFTDQVIDLRTKK